MSDDEEDGLLAKLAREHEKHQLEREKQELERAKQREERELERLKQQLEREREREERELEREKQRAEREQQREQHRIEREAEAFKRYEERLRHHKGHGDDHDHDDDDVDPYDLRSWSRAYRQRAMPGADGKPTGSAPAASGDDASHTASHTTDGSDPGDRTTGAPWSGPGHDPFSQHWEQHWMRAERALRRRIEQHRRWEVRRAEHRKRWKQHKQHWKHLRAEREMWKRAKDPRTSWGPWWLQARMRKRIFIWLTLSFIGGAVAMYYWPVLHWWHGLIALFLLSAVSGAVSIRMTRPLLMVIQVAQDIGEGKFETRLDVDGHRGETRVLAIAINDMAERIEQQLKDQRQLLAAVSHELRTPLGHMRVLIETARNTVISGAAPGAAKPADCKALGELEREVMVLDDLVGRLLASSRLEFGNLDCRPLDLGELVSDVATSAGVAPEAIEAIGDVSAEVDPTLIRRAVANLLDNARIHGNGAVAVRIERRARQVAIEVDDAGPGVPADRRADAFRAFVPSRAGGLGLGLALVSRIAVAHNGGAWITDRPGGGARVGFTVEIAPPAPREDE